jgi:hypothetical protein
MGLSMQLSQARRFLMFYPYLSAQFIDSSLVGRLTTLIATCLKQNIPGNAMTTAGPVPR